MLKLVFYVEDSETKKVIVEKSQILIEFTESELQDMDNADAGDLAKANALIGECFANQANWGRSKYLREKFATVGIIVGKFLDRSLSPRFGAKHIELLDKANTKLTKLEEQESRSS